MKSKGKVSFIERLFAVEDYLSGKRSAAKICSELSIHKQSLRNWVRKYQVSGEIGLSSTTNNKTYSQEIRNMAVSEYLDGNISQEQICTKYKISSYSVLQRWIKKYNSHKISKSCSNRGDRIMTNGRKTSYEERIEIVSFCIANDNDYTAATNKFKVSYQQVYTWVKKYKANGYEALLDRRGKHKKADELTESEKLSAQLKLIEAENLHLRMENDFLKKITGDRKAVDRSKIPQKSKYIAIKELHMLGYSICKLCKCAKVTRAAYYKWLKRTPTLRDNENSLLLDEILKLYSEVEGIYGYRRITLNINRKLDSNFNHKRIYRLMKSINLTSVIRKKRKKYIYSTPQITAENVLNRDFTANKPNEKWLTDVTEFKLTNGKKAYLSAILDLGDNSIVSYVLGYSNNNKLVFDTLDKAVASNPAAKPLFHSDRGFQYTNKKFKYKLDVINAVQSMSRVGRCIDNGPMEGFWGILKSEIYYLRKFNTYLDLEQAIDRYIEFYNTRRLQKKLKGMTPLEYRRHTLVA
jgi:transposase InsO family protein/transposase-like protein